MFKAEFNKIKIFDCFKKYLLLTLLNKFANMVITKKRGKLWKKLNIQK